MTTLLVHGGILVGERQARPADVLVEDGLVAAIQPSDQPPRTGRVADARGLAEYAPLDAFSLADAMQRCAELDLLLALHAEDADATRQAAEDARGRGDDAPLAWARSRPPETELDAVCRALEVAHETAARVH